MPDNIQINEALRYAKNTFLVDVDQLFLEGRKLIQYTWDIIETASWARIRTPTSCSRSSSGILGTCISRRFLFSWQT
jgi:Family of unknown function (DUF5923)